MSKVKALALPIFRHYWLWTACEGGSSTSFQSLAASTAMATRSWRDGQTLEEKFSIVGQRFADWFQRRLGVEWHKLESAKEGTLRNRGYRLAQAVLAREDPRETFLKSIPKDHAAMQIIYPGSLHQKVVRRRLRALAKYGSRRHRRRIAWWSLAMIPQLPLMLTPLPNITVYYTVYRLYSHLRALQGSKALDKGFTALDSQQLRALRDDLLRMKAATGVVYPEGSWPARLIRKEERYLDIFDRLKLLQKQRRLEALYHREFTPTVEHVLDARDHRPVAGPIQDRTFDEAGVLAAAGAEGAKATGELDDAEEISGDTGMSLSFYPSAELDELVQPAERLRSPLTDVAAMQIGQAFGVNHLLELVARARKRAVGSMFPAHTEEWPSMAMKDGSGKKEK